MSPISLFWCSNPWIGQPEHSVGLFQGRVTPNLLAPSAVGCVLPQSTPLPKFPPFFWVASRTFVHCQLRKLNFLSHSYLALPSLHACCQWLLHFPRPTLPPGHTLTPHNALFQAVTRPDHLLRQANPTSDRTAILLEQAGPATCWTCWSKKLD
jgi:hypothetical protein